MSRSRERPRVAIACSGLGRVHRGNETWAQGVAEKLYAAGTDVVLFGGGRLDAACPYRRVPSLGRDSLPGAGRISWERRYLWEQLTFAAALRWMIRGEGFQIVHVADPALAIRLRKDLPAGGPRVVYKDGLLLGPGWCSLFDHVQVLAPYYLDLAREVGVCTEGWHVIPHLVDPERFEPAPDREALRGSLLPPAARAADLVVLAVGDLSEQSNKRLAWIVREISEVPEALSVFTIVLGQADRPTYQSFRRHAEGLLGDRVLVMANVPAEAMPGWYQVADIFVHAALREPFGIVFLEAMSSGLPVLGHDFEVTAWIIGDGGQALDMTEEGALSRSIGRLAGQPETLSRLGRLARERASTTFSPDAIVPLYEQAYQSMLRSP